MDASHVYVRALALGCFGATVILVPEHFGGRGDKECPFSGVTKSGSLEEGAGKRCSECGTAPVLFAHTDIALTKPVSPRYGVCTFLPVWYLPTRLANVIFAACMIRCSLPDANSP